jgi:hypothetical protein
VEETKDDKIEVADVVTVPSEEKTSPSAPNVPSAVSIIEPAYKTTKTAIMNPVEYQQIKLLANDLLKAGALPSGIKNAEQVFVLMWTGREMGISPFDSVNSLYMVNGGVRIYGKAVMAQLRKHGYSVEYKDETEGSVTAVVTNKTTGETYKETYTFLEAQKSGYVGANKFGWNMGINRKLKLRYGALSVILRTYIPDVLGSAAGIVEVDEDVKVNDTSSIDRKKQDLLEKLKTENGVTDEDN